jgi:uncharacterized protein YqgQ
MNTVFDVQQVLKRFGTFIYTGDRFGDLDLMEMEMHALYKAGFISVVEYRQAILVLRKEASLLQKERGEND